MPSSQHQKDFGLPTKDRIMPTLPIGTGTENDQGAGLIKYDAATGDVLETAQFAPTDADPHGLTLYNGVFYSCDAGVHPGWPDEKSPTHGYIFRIDLI